MTNRKSLETFCRIRLHVVVISKLRLPARAAMQGKTAQLCRCRTDGTDYRPLANIEVLAQDKGIKFDVDAKEELTVNGGQSQTAPAFSSTFWKNAVRYTPPDVIFRSPCQQEFKSVVSISDTGIGIPPEHLPAYLRAVSTVSINPCQG